MSVTEKCWARASVAPLGRLEPRVALKVRKTPVATTKSFLGYLADLETLSCAMEL